MPIQLIRLFSYLLPDDLVQESVKTAGSDISDIADSGRGKAASGLGPELSGFSPQVGDPACPADDELKCRLLAAGDVDNWFQQKSWFYCGLTQISIHGTFSARGRRMS